MSKSALEDSVPEEQVSNKTWDAIRAVLLVVALMIGVWYCFFRTKPEFGDRHVEGYTMGTVYYSVLAHGVPIHSGKQDFWETLSQKIQQRLDEIDRAMSTYKPDSDVSRFNDSDSTDWFDVSSETAQVVQLAQTVSKLSNGAFDITVGPLVDLWGFGPKTKLFSVSELEGKVHELMGKIGFEKLDVRMNPPALKKSQPDLRIDLSAIAKGFAVDAIGELLETNGISNYRVEIGGEVRCHGKKTGGKIWAIGIEEPLLLPPGTPYFAVYCRLFLKDLSMATSGDNQNYRSVDGVKFSHIIDPRTGFPTEKIAQGTDVPQRRVASVSVIEPTCVQADALATAMFVLGPDEGIKLADSLHLPVLFLLRSHSDDPMQAEISEKASAAFLEQFPDKEDGKKRGKTRNETKK